MASYEYQCSGTCSEIVEKHRSILEGDPGYVCSTCNSPLNRVYLSVGIAFKGKNFYSTDNRKR